MRTVWDGRFVFETGRAGKSLLSRVNNEANNGAIKIKQTPILARLGRKGWSQIVGRMPELRHSMIPWPVRLSLPALWCGKKVGMVPHLEYIDETVIQPRFEVHLTGFCPANSLA